jgi:hypothetical protein
MYRISSRGQPTRGGPPAWGLGEILNLTVKTNFVTEHAYGAVVSTVTNIGVA